MSKETRRNPTKRYARKVKALVRENKQLRSLVNFLAEELLKERQKK